MTEGYGNDSRHDFDGKSPEELEADIVRTRERLSRNVDDLSFKLSPEGLSRDAQSALGDTQQLTFGAIEDLGKRLSERGVGWGTGTAAFVRRNPVPTTLLGIGLAWLVMRSRGQH